MKAIILMTRIPLAGRTKTRLMELLSPEECAEIHRCFLRDIFEELSDMGTGISTFVSYAPEGDYSQIEELIPSYAISFEQRGGNLGERMMNSLKGVFEMGYEEVLLLGTDIPELVKDDIYKAFEVLKKKDICIGPTLDGGYYLIGMKELQKFLFEDNIAWGNRSVLETTFKKASQLGLAVGLGSKHRDIDRGDDYLYLEKKLVAKNRSGERVPQNTFKFQRNRLEEVDYAER